MKAKENLWKLLQGMKIFQNTYYNVLLKKFRYHYNNY